MDIHQLKREVVWYRDEVALNEKALRAAKEAVASAERKLLDNKRKYDGYVRDLARAEEAERRNKTQK